MAEWKVVRQRNGRESVVVAGNENDMRKYISDNYPRVHVEPNSPDGGVPDALLVSDTGAYSAFHGPETGFVDTDKDGVPQDSKKASKKASKKTDARKQTSGSTAPSFGGSNDDNDNGGTE